MVTFAQSDWRQPPDKPLTLASYVGGALPKAFIEPVKVGDALREMPLFLEQEWYVNVPLEETCQEAYASLPKRWRDVVEGA